MSYDLRLMNYIRLIILAIAGAAIGASPLAYPMLNAPPWLLLGGVEGATILTVALLVAAATIPVLRMRMRLTISSVLAAVFVTQWTSTAWWPNSGDEYGYTYLAQTLLHGRLWNDPAPVPHIFDMFWIFTKEGKQFSQYAPGFPALLVPFVAVGAPWLLNPLLSCALAFLCLDLMRALGTPREAARALAAMLMFSPFVLFNAASLYPHMLTAVIVLGIIRLDVAWNARANRTYLLATGALFSMLLVTRYEVFAIVAGLYLPARAIARRMALWRDIWPLALGAMPLSFCFFFYNTAITGHPFLSPYAWSSPGAGYGLYVMGDGGVNTPLRALARSLRWACELAAYAGGALPVLAVAAFGKRPRQLTWYSLIFPVTVAFFLLFPSSGGHRFGPRYWFFAWPPAVLTIVQTLLEDEAWLRIGRRRVHLPTLAALHLPVFAGFAVTVALFNSQYVALRRQVYADTPQHTPALVLIPTRRLVVSRFEVEPILAPSADFARNGVNLNGPVLYGQADDFGTRQADYLALACSLHDRDVYVWRAKGVLEDARGPHGACAPQR